VERKLVASIWSGLLLQLPFLLLLKLEESYKTRYIKN